MHSTQCRTTDICLIQTLHTPWQHQRLLALTVSCWWTFLQTIHAKIQKLHKNFPQVSHLQNNLMEKGMQKTFKNAEINSIKKLCISITEITPSQLDKHMFRAWMRHIHSCVDKLPLYEHCSIQSSPMLFSMRKRILTEVFGWSVSILYPVPNFQLISYQNYTDTHTISI